MSLAKKLAADAKKHAMGPLSNIGSGKSSSTSLPSLGSSALGDLPTKRIKYKVAK